MKLIDLYFDSTSVILASRVKRSGVHLVLSGGSLVSCGMCYLVCFALSDKNNVFSSPCCRNPHSLCNFFVFLLSEDWILSISTERMSLDTAQCGGKAQSFHTHPAPSEGPEHPHLTPSFPRHGMHIWTLSTATLHLAPSLCKKFTLIIKLIMSPELTANHGQALVLSTEVGANPQAVKAMGYCRMKQFSHDFPKALEKLLKAAEHSSALPAIFLTDLLMPPAGCRHIFKRQIENIIVHSSAPV